MRGKYFTQTHLAEIYVRAFYMCAICVTLAFSLKNYCGSYTKSYCYDVCGYHRHPQTLAEIFRNMGICCVFRAVATRGKYPGFMSLWPTSVSHHFSSLNSSLGLTGGEYYQKITISIFRLILQHFAVTGCFSYMIFNRYHFSLLFSGWFVIIVYGSISVRELKVLELL